MSEINVHTDVQDLSWYSSTTQGYSSAYSPPSAPYDTFEDEAPLLEGWEFGCGCLRWKFVILLELGIDIAGIMKKSKAMLMMQLNSVDLEDLDMGGPLLIAVALGAIHLVVRHTIHLLFSIGVA